MHFQADPVTINALLSVNKQYFIPRYQRDFSWTKENIDELWADLIGNMQKEENSFICEEYFLGTLVLAGREEDFEVEVVDGQQRLTVITMFISAICRAMNEIGDVRAASSTFSTYIKASDRRGVEFPKLDKRSQTNYFKLAIQDLQRHPSEPESEEDELVRSAFAQISRLISKPSLKKALGIEDEIDNQRYSELLNLFLDLILDHLKVIRVNVLNSDDAYTIFEILNARGINLSPIDLIKNKVLQEWVSTYPIDFAKTKWNEIIRELSSRETRISLEEYSINHWTTKFAYTSKRNIYKAFKKQWDAGNITSENYLLELHADCNAYIKISVPLLTDWPQSDQRGIYNSLNSLSIFNVSIMRSFLLSLFKARSRGFIKQRRLIQTLNKIENFHFMFNAICSLRPSGIEGIYAKNARNLTYATNTRECSEIIADVIQTLEERKPTREYFINKFVGLQFLNKNTSNKKLIQYIFTKMERKLRSTNEFEPSDLSLEHIKNQSDQTIPLAIIGSIGNLLPMGEMINGNAATVDFIAKKMVYQNSNYYVVQEFLNGNPQDEWTEELIMARTQNLAEYAYDIIWR
ncbi:hypothetical protein CBX96_09230 [Shewanella sp. BC20]|uniref:DUF262 domain-containing protein n=1 Tax=Shewanella sp. BC20 TaxID=2004459 RepID=UPI000D64992C|nr:DUF262 domain-containing protein [Shewanella sp. BC20]PWF63643.1 hypothetical protein CBX96_09230 [Shewanella sp. BC20]